MYLKCIMQWIVAQIRKWKENLKKKKIKKGHFFSSQHLSRPEPTPPIAFETGQDNFWLWKAKKRQDYYVIQTIETLLFPNTVQPGTELEKNIRSDNEMKYSLILETIRDWWLEETGCI